MNNTVTKNILIVDDHPVVRYGIRSILSAESGYKICCEADSESSAIEQATNCTALDLAILDLSLSQNTSFSLFKKLITIHPKIRLLVYSLHDENVYAEKVLQAGAHGYLMKGATSKSLLEALDTIINGGLYVSKNVQENFIKALKYGKDNSVDSVMSLLTKTELTVLQLIGKGLTLKEIGLILHRSPKTVDVHRANIKNKLGIANNNQLIQFASQWIST